MDRSPLFPPSAPAPHCRPAGWQTLPADENLPAALLDLDALDANIAALLQRAAGTPIRVVSKSVRCPAVLRYLLAQPGMAGLMCFSADEAAKLAAQGFNDILVAYPTVQRAQIKAVCEQIRAGKNIRLMLDCAAHLSQHQSVAAAAGVLLPVAFDLDMSTPLPGLHFGVHRSPLKTTPQVLALYAQLRQCPNLRLEAVMGYEAQIAGVGDAVPGKALENLFVRGLQRWAIPRLQQRRQAMVAALRRAGAELRVVNGGGTGSIESTCADGCITEVAVGSGFYAPTLFDNYRRFALQPAALFALEVVRQPGRAIVTCAGGGYIGSGAAGPGKAPTPYLPAGLSLTQRESAGEVQTPLHCAGSAPAIGSSVLFRPAKAGEFTERFNELLLVRGGRVLERAATYRGLGWSFF